MTANKNVTEETMERSVIVILSYSRLRTKRTVGTDEIETEADKTMLHVAKDILDSEELRAISAYDWETKRWFKKRASGTPPYLRGGSYLLSVDLVADAYAHLDSRQDGRKDLIAKFKDAYPGKVKDAKKRLGPLFDAEDYPHISAIEDAFDMKFAVLEISPSKKLQAISKSLFEREQAKAKVEWSSATDKVREALVASMAGLVEHAAERLSGGTDGKPKRFRQAMITNMNEFLDLYEKRDVTNYAELAKLVASAKKLMLGVDAEQLRDDEKLRARVAKGFTEIKNNLDTMLEDKPKRRMSLKDEEV